MTMDEWLEANGIDPADVSDDQPIIIVADDIITYAEKDADGGSSPASTWCHVRPPEDLGIIEV